MCAKKKRSKLSEDEASALLPDLELSPMCERCSPYGRCHGLSQVEDSDWIVLKEIICSNKLSNPLWPALKMKYKYLELERLIHLRT